MRMTRRSAALRLVLVLSFCNVALAQPTGTFTPTGNMLTQRFGGHTATLLPDGKVLIAGGFVLVDTPTGLRNFPLASAELYDPATGTFSATGNMATVPGITAAILLNDGKVLIADG